MALFSDLLANYVNARFCSVNAAFFVANGVVLWPERLGQNQPATPGQQCLPATYPSYCSAPLHRGRAR
jgi:hypothetical protein